MSATLTRVPQGMPNLGVPLVNSDGTVGMAWYRFFVSLYNTMLLNNISMEGPIETTAVAGTGGAPPAQVQAYLDITIAQVHYRIPLYKA